MGCKFTTTKNEKNAEAQIHSVTSPESEPSPRIPTNSPHTNASGATQKPIETVSSPATPKDKQMLSLPTDSSSREYSPYYDPLPEEACEKKPAKEPTPKKSKQKHQQRNAQHSTSMEKVDVMSDTSSRYSMSIERQRDRPEAADSPASNGSFNVDLGGSIRSASSGVSRTGDTVLDRGHGMTASHLVSDHPQTSDHIALLLSPRQRPVPLNSQLPSAAGNKTTSSGTRKAGGPPANQSRSNEKNQRRTPVPHDDDNELVLACLDCGMEILDDGTPMICPLTGKLHN